MSFNLSSATLKGLVSLVEKRDRLQTKLAKVELQISATLDGKAPKAKVAGPVPKTKRASKGKRGKRGALKESVLAELKIAGKKGVSVKDLSSKLGIKNQNLHVWFSSTGKAIKGLKRTGPGRWTLAA